VGRGTALATVPSAEKGALLVPTIALVAGARYVPNLHFVHTVSHELIHCSAWIGFFTSLLSFSFWLFVDDMPLMLAPFVFISGDRCRFFVWQHRFASHEIFKTGR
jgi:hypothetical protein